MKRFAGELFRLLSVTFGDVLLRHRLVVVTGVQVGLILSANLIAFGLRFEGEIPSPYMQRMLQGIPIVALIYGMCLWGFGIQRALALRRPS